MIIANIAEVITSASQLSYNDIVTAVLVVDDCKVVYHYSQDTANLVPRGYPNDHHAFVHIPYHQFRLMSLTNVLQHTFTASQDRKNDTAHSSGAWQSANSTKRYITLHE